MNDEMDRRDDDVVDGEIVAEYSDTRLNLPEITDDDPEEQAGAQVDNRRRGFLTRLLLGGVGALTLGGGAALFIERQRRTDEPQVVVLPNGSEVDTQEVSHLYARISELEHKLTETTAERDQLISELAQIEAELSDVALQLSDALDEIDQLQTVNTLWRQLDDVDLDGIVRGALVAVGGALSVLLGVNNVLRTGLAIGKGAVDTFADLIPEPRDGIRWLQRQVTSLADNLDWLGQQVQEAVEPVEPFTQLVSNFVLWVLDRLPFGIGSRAEAGLEAMRTVINALPAFIEGINDDVLDPLAEWFSTDEDKNIDGILLTPVKDEIIEPSREVMVKVTEFEETYQSEFVVPVEEALEERQTLRGQIETAQQRLRM